MVKLSDLYIHASSPLFLLFSRPSGMVAWKANGYNALYEPDEVLDVRWQPAPHDILLLSTHLIRRLPVSLGGVCVCYPVTCCSEGERKHACVAYMEEDASFLRPAPISPWPLLLTSSFLLARPGTGSFNNMRGTDHTNPHPTHLTPFHLDPLPW